MDREHVCYRDTDVSANRKDGTIEETIGREERGWVDGGWEDERTGQRGTRVHDDLMILFCTEY